MEENVTLERLSIAEKRVFDALAKGFCIQDVGILTKTCGMTEFQVLVALQLLEFKKLITNKRS